jgi:hypothetical protein
MNFFQRYRTERAKGTEPVGEPPPLPPEDAVKPKDAVEPIHVSDAQYALLTRALRLTVEPALKDLPASVPGSNIPAIVEAASQPPSPNPGTVARDQPPGAPIV